MEKKLTDLRTFSEDIQDIYFKILIDEQLTNKKLSEYRNHYKKCFSLLNTDSNNNPIELSEHRLEISQLINLYNKDIKAFDLNNDYTDITADQLTIIYKNSVYSMLIDLFNIYETSLYELNAILSYSCEAWSEKDPETMAQLESLYDKESIKDFFKLSNYFTEPSRTIIQRFFTKNTNIILDPHLKRPDYHKYDPSLIFNYLLLMIIDLNIYHLNDEETTNVSYNTIKYHNNHYFELVGTIQLTLFNIYNKDLNKRSIDELHKYYKILFKSFNTVLNHRIPKIIINVYNKKISK